MSGSDNSLLIDCLSAIIGSLRNVEIDPGHRFELEWIISAYRRVFDDRYVSNRDGSINRDDIIAEEIRYPLYPFLERHHCCWIDFIGQESFSSVQPRQVFFSTLSMRAEDSRRREPFIEEYNSRIRQGWPADIFVQLFLQSYEDIDKALLSLGSGAAVNARIKEFYGNIRNHGLLIGLDRPPQTPLSDLPSVFIPCSPVDSVRDLHFDRVPGRPLAEEIRDFLLTLGQYGPLPPVQSPLVRSVVTLNRSLHEGVRYLYFLPVHSAKQTIGLCCFGTRQELSGAERQNLSILSYNILSPFISAYQSAWEKEQIMRESIVSSISSIMSRNMSHNLGSHVLSALSNPRESTYRLGGDAPYRGLFRIEGKNADAFHQVSNLITYLRFRMDYISDISFSPPSSLVPRLFLSQMLAELDRNRLLLNHISGLDRQFVYRFRFLNRTGICTDGKDDVYVAIPNDVIGAHALFNLTENVIRNVAKHENSPQSENVFTFSVSVPQDPQAADMYEVLLYHNGRKSHEEASCLAARLNAFIDRDVIEKNRKRREALGFVEMKASAAYLRQEDIQKVSTHFVCSPKLLEAAVIPSEDGKDLFHVAYRFYLLRPRDFVRVIPEGSVPGSDNRLMTLSALLSRLKDRQVLNQDFLVYDDCLEGAIGNLMPQYRTALPFRILRTSDFRGEPVTRDNCWKTWERLHDGVWPISTFENDYNPGIDPSRCAIILSHDGKGAPGPDGNAPNPFKDLVENHPEIVYLEGLSSSAASRLPGYYGLSDLTGYVGRLRVWEGIRKAEYCLCREMVNTRVFIVDERIQDAAYDLDCYGVPLLEHYRLSGVTVPDRGRIQLRSQEFSRELCEDLLSLIGERVRVNDFVLIHYGILERIFMAQETHRDDWHSLMKRQVDAWAAQGGAHIVVESGRGVPANLPTSVRFISNSSVFSALVEEKSKMMLNILLYSSRRTVL